MDYRIERDTIGEMKVPSDKYWGAQTQRSFQNFPIGDEKMPVEIINGFAILKKSAARANEQLGLLDSVKADAIAHAADRILSGELTEHFPLVVGNGSGTQSNMNVNEVQLRMLEMSGLKSKEKKSDCIRMTMSTSHKARMIRIQRLCTLLRLKKSKSMFCLPYSKLNKRRSKSRTNIWTS